MDSRKLARNFRLRQVPQTIWTNRPDFYAPLTHNLLLSNGQGVATFTRTTTATCWCYLENAVAGASLVLQDIPSGIPRFEGARFIASNNTWSNLLSDGSAIPEATLKGVLIETTATNLMTQSVDYTQWTKLNGGTGVLPVVTANYAVAPNGLMEADRVQFDIGAVDLSSSFSVLNRVAAKSVSVNYTSDTWVKSNTGSSQTFTLYDTSNTQTISAEQTATTEWTRVKLKFGTTSSASCNLVVGCRGGTDASVSGGAQTADLLFWSTDVVDGRLFASSTIPTVASTVTRNADVLTFPNAGNVSDTDGTVLMDVTPAFDIPNSSAAGYGDNRLIDFGSNSGYILTILRQLRRSDGSLIITTPAWTPLKNTTYKIGSHYGSAGQRNWMNGTAGTNGAFDGSIDSGTNMTIGGRGTDIAYNWGGNIKNVKIWKKQLTDSQITHITTP